MKKLLPLFLSVLIILAVSGCSNKSPDNSSIPKNVSYTLEFVKFGNEYDNIFVDSITEINGEIAYRVENDGKQFIVYDGKEIGKEYDKVYSPININNKLAFIAVTGENIFSGKSLIVYDGKEIGKQYERVLSQPIEVNGKLVYIAENEGSKFIVYDGTEMENIYADIDSLTLTKVGNTIAYVATEEYGSTNRKWFIVYGEQELGKQYDNVGSPREINGKLSYMATKDNKTFVVYDGQEFGKEYDYVYPPKEVNGKLLYTAAKGDIQNRTWFVIYDGREIDGGYDNNPYVIGINGKIAYLASKKGESFIVYDGQEIGKEYNAVANPANIDGKLAYIAIEDDVSGKRTYNTFILYQNQQIGKEYDSIGGLSEINKKLAFVANRDGKWFIVMEK